MKKLKLDHELAQQVKTGKKTSTIRLFDDKDLSVNDELVLIDKVDPKSPQTWQVIGTATINQVTEKRLGDLTDEDLEGHKPYTSKQEMLTDFRQHYGEDVTLQTPAKVVHFAFSQRAPRNDVATVIPRGQQVTIYADGGSRGNPGPSASGYVIYDAEQTMLAYRGIYLGITTNNQAEYTALKLALEEARTLGASKVDVFMDSMLVINQMKGIFKVKNRDLWPIHDAVRQLAKQFSKITFTQIPREMNKLADAAVNQALDEQLRQNNAAH